MPINNVCYFINFYYNLIMVEFHIFLKFFKFKDSVLKKYLLSYFFFKVICLRLKYLKIILKILLYQYDLLTGHKYGSFA